MSRSRSFPLRPTHPLRWELTLDRRRFLEAALGAAAIAALPSCEPEASSAGDGALTTETTARALPIAPHRAIALPGFHAYADRDSYAPGETVSLMVSNDVAYHLDVVRFGTIVDSMSADAVLASADQSTAFPQAIYPGSYIHAGAGLPAANAITGLTLECWIRMFRVDQWTAMIAQHNFPDACGYGIFVTPGGNIWFYTGSGGAYSAAYTLQANGLILTGQWHHVVATFDGTNRAIWIDGVRRATAGSPGTTVYPGTAPLRLGAYGSGTPTVANQFMNGDLSLPAIYTRALTDAEIIARHRDGGRTIPTLSGLWACWPLAEESGTTVADTSGSHPGTIVNRGTWMIGGPSFDRNIGPFTDPFRGRLLRFSGGSYLLAPAGLPAATAIPALTLECWIRPVALGWTCMVGQHDYPNHCGYGLFIDGAGAVWFFLGNGGAWQATSMVSAPGTVAINRWYHIAGTYDGTSRSLYVNGVRIRGPEAFSGPVIPGNAPLRAGAYGANGVVGQFFNGDLAMPAIYNYALSQAEISARLDQRAQIAPASGLYACWPLIQAGGTYAPEVTGAHPGEVLHLGEAKWIPGCPGDPTVGRSLQLYPGEYVGAPGLSASAPIAAMTVECWVRSMATDQWVGFLTQHDYPNSCGFGLFMAPGGVAVFYSGTGLGYDANRRVDSAANAIGYGRWHHLAGVWNGSTISLYVDGQSVVAPRAISGTVAAGAAPIRIGAYLASGATGQFLNGDVAMPAIYSRALSAAEIAARYADGGRSLPSGSVTACWPLDETAGTFVHDLAGLRHGTLVVVSGATARARFVTASPSSLTISAYSPTADPNRGHALRLASDDLYDCEWSVRHTYTIPGNAASGLYEARFRIGSSSYYHVPFIVRRAPSPAPTAPILVLAAMNTWRAYNSQPFAGLHHTAGQPELWSTTGPLNSSGSPIPPNPDIPDHPVYSCYRAHSGAGQPTYQVGLRMPMPSASPFALYGDAATNYSHLMRAERFLHAWLERAGYTFDLATDLDLHRDANLLTGYRCVIIAGHSEYWSAPMYQHLEQYLSSGGNVLCMSGNTMFWRVGFDAAMTVMECRKFDARIGGTADALKLGEAWHSTDGLRGGLIREAGYPALHLLGAETLGWVSASLSAFGDYRVLNAAHPFFTTPNPTGLTNGSRFGATASRRAVGHELDITWARHRALRNARDAARFGGQPVFEHVAMGVAGENPATEYANIQLLADTTLSPPSAFDLYGEELSPPAVNIAGELFDWQRPGGGRVVNLASIGVAWELDVDPVLQAFVRNVLAAFGV